MINYTFLLFLSIAFVYQSFAADTPQIHLIKAVVIVDKVERLHISMSTYKIDTQLQRQSFSRNLAELLGLGGNMFIKNYGAGSIATIGLRGASAAQSQLVWNDIPLNNLMLGQVDLSLFPTQFFNEIQVSNGNHATQWGSGAQAGAVILRNTLLFNSGYSCESGIVIGSFGERNIHFKTSYGTKNSFLNFGVLNRKAINNFSFERINQFGEPETIKQSHNQLNHTGFQFDFSKKTNKNLLFSFHYRLTDSYREIPPLATQVLSKALQKDVNHHAVFRFELPVAKGKWVAKSAFISETIHFNDSLSKINSKTNALVSFNEVEFFYHPNKKHFFHLGGQYRFQQAFAENYFQVATLPAVSIFAHYHYQPINRLIFTSGYRVENQTQTAQVYQFGAKWYLLNQLFLRANAGSVFRFPTMNDLFWIPGGNLYLKPEQGFSADAGVAAYRYIEKLYFKAEADVFHRLIDNWIAWQPQGAFWKAENVRAVWSRGLDTRWTIEYKQRNTFISFKLQTQYVLSTVNQVSAINDASLNKQLIYSPLYTGNASLQLQLYNQFSCTWHTQYVGYRYTTSDNTQFLSPYLLHHLNFSYQLKTKALQHEFVLWLNNITQQDYTVMLHRPMPGFSFQIGYKINFNNQSIIK